MTRLNLVQIMRHKRPGQLYLFSFFLPNGGAVCLDTSEIRRGLVGLAALW